jgi:hypothetical protein
MKKTYKVILRQIIQPAPEANLHPRRSEHTADVGRLDGSGHLFNGNDNSLDLSRWYSTPYVQTHHAARLGAAWSAI